MSSQIKSIFFNLGKKLKSFVFFNLEKFKKQQKINRQIDLDKKIVSNLSNKKLPTWRQFKKLPSTLNKNEGLIIKILALIVLACFGILIYLNLFRNLQSVARDGGEFAEGLVGSPLYLNPILAHSDADHDLTSLIFSSLLKYNENLELVPDLAEKYEISEDQKTYTFYLKKNVKWHDQENLTASDVVFTINSILDPDYKSPLLRSYSGVGVEKVDDYTVKFTLQEPYAAFLNLMTVGIIPQHLWYDIPAVNATLAILNQKPIGSGPYKFKTYVKEKNGVIKAYTLEKNNDYYDKKPYINKIIFKFYPDFENAVNALVNKEIQSLSFLPKDYAKKFINKRDINLLNYNLSQYTAVFFNQKNNKLLEDKKIREALSYAIDKNKILEDALQNQGQIIDGPILPGFLGYDSNIKKYEYNPQKALEILTADGWNLDNEFLKKKDQELKISLTTVDQGETAKTAELIKEFWTSIGVNVDLQLVAKNNIEKDVIAQRNYQVLIYGEIIGYDPDLLPFWHSSQKDAPGLNLANYINRKTDVLLEEARMTNDSQARADKYREFQNLLIDDIPAIFLYSPTYAYPVSKKIQGLNQHSIANPADRFINIENWFIKTKQKFIK